MEELQPRLLLNVTVVSCLLFLSCKCKLLKINKQKPLCHLFLCKSKWLQVHWRSNNKTAHIKGMVVATDFCCLKWGNGGYYRRRVGLKSFNPAAEQASAALCEEKQDEGCQSTSPGILSILLRHSKHSCNSTYGCAILEELHYLCNLTGLQVAAGHAISSDKGTSENQN